MARRWRFLCHCGKEVMLRPYKVLDGKRTSCGCRLKTLACKDPTMSRFIRRHITKYARSAQVRGVEWSLTDSDAMTLFSENCYYCGAAPNLFLKSSKGETAPRAVNGIDRVDNDKGYTKNNTVSCCSNCNYAKGDMAQHSFIAMIESIYRHLHL